MRLPWGSLLLALACVLPQLGGEAFVRELAFQRGHDGLAGALVAQFAHWGWAHVLGNALVLLVCGGYLEARLGRARLALLTLVTWLASAACLLLAVGLSEYRGASAITSAWLTTALIVFSGVRTPWGKFALGLAAGLLFSLPAWLGVDSGVLPAGVRPVWELHLLAAVLAGGLAALWHMTGVTASPLPPVGEGSGERGK